MSHDLQAFAAFIGKGLAGIWPYLLLTIPLAVAVRVSGAARHLERVLSARPVTAILLASLVGALSPFCSCSVVPVVASLLLGGVPLGPVMSFWIASPSMDPEMFLLSVASLGWELALWRLGATLVLSLGAGFVTQWLWRRGLLGEAVLATARQPNGAVAPARWKSLIEGPTTRAKAVLDRARAALMRRLPAGWRPARLRAALTDRLASIAELTGLRAALVRMQPEAATPLAAASACGCSAEAPLVALASGAPRVSGQSSALGASPTPSNPLPATAPTVGPGSGLGQRVWRETVTASLMVAKFMVLAYALEALFELYVPAAWIAALVGAQSPLPVLSAALIGVPLYTSNLAALPLIAGLLQQGMAPAAALAFLIAGPTTTLPAMAAVWGLVNRRVFALYVGFAFFGALVAGAAWNLAH